MLKLMKYEFRKQLFSKYIIVAFLGILEVIFFFGLILDRQSLIAVDLGIFLLLAIGSLTYVSVECLATFSNDLKTKCSYMLFMTPHSSYTIIGAKVLSMIVQVFGTAAVFTVLGLCNGAMLLGRYHMLNDFIQTVLDNFHWDFNVFMIIGNILMAIANWSCIVLFAFLAITASTTFLANKKGKGMVSFLIFLLICFINAKTDNIILSNFTYMSDPYIGISLVINLIFGMIAYLLTSYLLEEKVSL